MAKENITLSSNIAGNPREIDFVTKFGDNWQEPLSGDRPSQQRIFLSTIPNSSRARKTSWNG